MKHHKKNKLFKLLHGFILPIMTMMSCAVLHAQPIKIGIAGSFSGANKAIGAQHWQGASQAAEDINQQGGIDGNKIELINADDGCDDVVAEKVAKRLVDSQVVAVVGHTCSGASLAASKIYSEANTLMITPSSTDPKVTDQGFKTIFRTCGTNDKQATVGASFINEKLKAKNIAIIYVNIPYSSNLASATKDNLTKRGVNIALYESITLGQWDISRLLDKIKNANPDVIYFAGMYQDAGNFLKKLRQQEIQSTFFSGDSIATADFVQIAGGPSIVKDVYMTFSEHTSNSDAKNVISRFKDKRIDAEGYTLNAYAAVQAIALAIKQTGSRDVNKLQSWLHSNKVDSVIGQLEWDSKGDLKNYPFIIYQWNDDGEFEPY